MLVPRELCVLLHVDFVLKISLNNFYVQLNTLYIIFNFHNFSFVAYILAIISRMKTPNEKTTQIKIGTKFKFCFIRLNVTTQPN